MKGNRGSGLRLIIPPGAVDSPVRVTCRYYRRASTNAAKLYFVIKDAANNRTPHTGNTKGGSITVPLTSCLTGFGLVCFAN
jgi:hypothetical protein